MNRLAFLILSSGICNLATADVCTQIADDKERLACFDAALACADLGSESGRLDCFDSAYSGADPSDISVDDRSVPQDVIEAPDSPVEQSTEMQVADDRNISQDVPEEPDPSAERSAQVQIADDDKAPLVAKSSVSSGDFAEERTSEAPKETIEAIIVELKSDARDIDYLWLDNGQVWRESTDSIVRFKVGRKVIIKEGALGSHNLTMEGIDRNAKVIRIQ